MIIKQISLSSGTVVLYNSYFVMAALCNRAGHHIFALWFVSSFFLA